MLKTASPVAVDFDNTIVCYDDLALKVAAENGLLDKSETLDKRTVREKVRRLPDGELKWQRIQAIIYGPRIQEASLSEGVVDFFRACRESAKKIYVVSHKSEYAEQDETNSNLRDAAMGWMIARGFFDDTELGFAIEDIFFEETRVAKLERVQELQCSHLIDDLEETFLEELFPQEVGRILYSPRITPTSVPGVEVANNWKEITDLVLNSSF